MVGDSLVFGRTAGTSSLSIHPSIYLPMSIYRWIYPYLYLYLLISVSAASSLTSAVTHKTDVTSTIRNTHTYQSGFDLVLLYYRESRSCSFLTLLNHLVSVTGAADGQRGRALVPV